jgi:hypothetical protein
MTSSPTRVLLVALLAVPVFVLAVIGVILGVPWWIVAPLAVLVVVVATIGVVRSAPGIVLARLGVKPADLDGAHVRFGHIVDGLCLANGIRQPALGIVDDDSPNGLVVGRSAEEATIAVTTGLLEGLGRTELEGVLAHLLARVRAPGLADETLAAVVIGMWMAPVPVLQRRALARVVADHPAVLADREAVAMTRYPPGLVSAFATIQDADHSLRSAGRSTRHLWIDDPARTSNDAIDIPLSERIDVLQEL